MKKRCRKCGETKPLEAFYRDAGSQAGRRSERKACTSARRKAWYAANREREIERVVAWQQQNREYYNQRQREYRREHREAERLGHLRRTFGLTLEDYELLLAPQLGGCAICGEAPGKISLHVDHDHESGEVRGLLCFRCNGGLGQFKEQPTRLLRAADYLTGDALPLREQKALIRKARERARKLQVAS
ncbi:MAG: endonuclease VII domain-containing protein [Acidimicrobiia bacterium]